MAICSDCGLRTVRFNGRDWCAYCRRAEDGPARAEPTAAPEAAETPAAPPRVYRQRAGEARGAWS